MRYRNAFLFTVVLLCLPVHAQAATDAQPMDKQTSALLLGFVGIAIVFNIFMILSQFRRRDRFRALASDGVETQAQIVECSPFKFKGRSFVRVNYTFPVATGEAKGSVQFEDGKGKEAIFVAGSRHPVVYLPASPKISVPKAELQDQIKRVEVACRIMALGLTGGIFLFITVCGLLISQGILQWPF